MINKISIIGGDLRIVKLAEMLIEEGVKVFTYGLENTELQEENKTSTLQEVIGKSDIVLGPIPFSSNGKTINTPFSGNKILVSDLMSNLSGKILIAGSIKPEIYEIASEKNIKVIDILKREELAVLNAVSTAEGTIKIAIEETPRNLHRSNILVLGFGRIGKIYFRRIKI